MRNGWGAVWTTIVALAVLCGAPTASSAQNDNLIVPGVRIGPFHLGITDAELYRQFGEPTATQVNGDVTMNYTYSNVQVSVSPSTHKVIQVTTSDPSFATAEGVTVGTSALALAAKLGVPKGCQGSCNFPYRGGLWVGTNDDGSVRAIWITDR